MLVEIRYVLPIKEKERSRGSQYRQKKKNLIRPKPAASTSHSESVNE